MDVLVASARRTVISWPLAEITRSEYISDVREFILDNYIKGEGIHSGGIRGAGGTKCLVFRTGNPAEVLSNVSSIRTKRGTRRVSHTL